MRQFKLEDVDGDGTPDMDVLPSGRVRSAMEPRATSRTIQIRSMQETAAAGRVAVPPQEQEDPFGCFVPQEVSSKGMD